MTPEQEAALAALVAAETLRYEQIDTNMLAQLRAILNQMSGDWWRASTTNEARDAMYDVVRGAQEAIADNTTAYLDEVYEVLEVDVPPRMQGTSATLPANLRQGIADRFAWDRPARDARVGVLLDGLDDFEANEKALWRAEQQARMDAALARREAERQRWGVSEDIIGFRRILHPELSRSGPCGLCIIAADRIYGKGDLKPLHNGCWCTTLPVTRSLDPGSSMNRQELDEFYDAAGGMGREDLQRVRVEVLEHGELGPILVDGNGGVLNPEGVRRRDAGFDPARVVRAQRKAIRRLEDDLAAGRRINRDRLNQHRRWLEKWEADLPADSPARREPASA